MDQENQSGMEGKEGEQVKEGKLSLPRDQSTAQNLADSTLNFLPSFAGHMTKGKNA